MVHNSPPRAQRDGSLSVSRLMSRLMAPGHCIYWLAVWVNRLQTWGYQDAITASTWLTHWRSAFHTLYELLGFFQEKKKITIVSKTNSPKELESWFTVTLFKVQQRFLIHLVIRAAKTVLPSPLTVKEPKRLSDLLEFIQQIGKVNTVKKAEHWRIDAFELWC